MKRSNFSLDLLLPSQQDKMKIPIWCTARLSFREIKQRQKEECDLFSPWVCHQGVCKSIFWDCQSSCQSKHENETFCFSRGSFLQYKIAHYILVSSWCPDHVLFAVHLFLSSFSTLKYLRGYPRSPLCCSVCFGGFKDGGYYCYCAYVLRILRYSDFLPVMLTNTVIFLRGLKLSGESIS